MSSTITYTVHNYGTTLGTALGTLTGWWGEQSVDILSDCGNGKLNIQNDDGQGTLLVPGRVVRKTVDSTAAFQWVVDHIVRHSIDEQEEANQFSEVSGDGIAQILARAAVQPTRGYSQTPWGPSRTFSFASREFSPDGSWGTATVLNLQRESSTYYEGLPTGWPDPNAAWICPSVDTDTTGHEGHWYAIGDFSLGTASKLVLFLAADNKADVYFDGFALTTFGTEVGFNETHRATVFAGTGSHRIAAKISNFVDGGAEPGLGMGTALSGDPTAFMCSCYPVDGAGKLGPLVIHTDDEWSVLEYPSAAPGWTVGEVERQLIMEAQTDGLLPGLATTFGTAVDSAGGTWDRFESFTLNVGDDYLSVLRGFGATYCDWTMSPSSLSLSMWRYAEQGVNRTVGGTAVNYTAGTNITSLVHDQMYSGTDALLVTWSGGQFRYPDSGGTFLRPFSAGNARTLAEATTLAQGELDRLGGTRIQYAAGIEPLGTLDQPYTGYTVGDTVNVPDTGGTSVAQRVVQIVGTSDDEAVPEWSPTFRDLFLDMQARIALNVRRATGGFLGGYSTVASPAGTPPEFGSKIDSSELSLSAPDPLALGTSTKTDAVSSSGNLFQVLAVLNQPNTSGTLTFEYQVDGTDVLNGAGAMGSGVAMKTFYVDMGSSQFTQWLVGGVSRIGAEVTALGTGAAGLVLKGNVL